MDKVTKADVTDRGEPFISITGRSRLLRAYVKEAALRTSDQILSPKKNFVARESVARERITHFQHGYV